MAAFESALVTGGGRRLGLIMARLLKKKGFDVVIHHRSLSALELECLRDEGFHVIGGDLTNEDCVLSLIQKASDMSKKSLRLLVNNAAIFGQSYTIEDYYTVNVKSPAQLMKTFYLYCGHGHIINILDGDIFQNQSGLLYYQWSKKSLHDISMMLKDQFDPHVRINHIAPSMLLKNSHIIDDCSFEKRRLRMAHPPTIDDFKKAISMLIDTHSMNGQTIVVGHY